MLTAACWILAGYRGERCWTSGLILGDSCKLTVVNVIYRQVINAKKKLLDKLHEDVAAKEDGGLKRMLGEDESVAKRRLAPIPSPD